MMRRGGFTPKKKAPKLDADGNELPPVPGSAAALPKRPKDLEEARLALVLELGGSTNVASGFGLVGPPPGGAWGLFVFTNNPGLKVPNEFRGFPVARRSIPEARVVQGAKERSHRR